jgi:hypothetical protein
MCDTPNYLATADARGVKQIYVAMMGCARENHTGCSHKKRLQLKPKVRENAPRANTISCGCLALGFKAGD